MTTTEHRTDFFLEVKIARLQSSVSRAGTLAGGALGAAAVLSPFAIAFLFVMPHDEYDPARLLIVVLAALFLTVGIVAWLAKRSFDRRLIAATAERIRAEDAARA